MKSEKPAKSGRPRCFCPDAALDHALAVFWRKGYDGASLTDLTTAMGINRPSLYAAYGNKETLFRRAMERYGERGAERLRAALTRPTARGFVEALLLGAAESLTDPAHPPGCFMLQAAGGSCGDSPALAGAVAGGRAVPMTAMRERFDRAVAAGELPVGSDATALARYFTAVLHGMAVQAAAGATAEALRDVATTALRAWPAAE